MGGRSAAPSGASPGAVAARSVGCAIGGCRTRSNNRQVGSLPLGFHDKAGKQHHVGFTAAIQDAERVALTTRLEMSIAPRVSPAMRWRPDKNWRPDKKPAQGTFDQPRRAWSPAKLVTDVIGR